MTFSTSPTSSMNGNKPSSPLATATKNFDLCWPTAPSSSSRQPKILFFTAPLVFVLCLWVALNWICDGQCELNSTSVFQFHSTGVGSGLASILLHPRRPPGCQKLQAEVQQDANGNSNCHAYPSLTSLYYLGNVKLGNGASSEVYPAVHRTTGILSAAIISQNAQNDTSASQNTIKYGTMLCGRPSVMQLQDIVCHEGIIVPIVGICTGFKAVEYFRTPEAEKTGCPQLSVDDKRSFIKSLLTGVWQLIDTGIRHKDLDLSNIFYNTSDKTSCIIDYGFATQYKPPYAELLHNANYRFANHTTKQELEAKIWKSAILHKNELYTPTEVSYSGDDTLAAISVVGSILSVPKPWLHKETEDLISDDIKSHRHVLMEYIQLHGSDKLLSFTNEWNLPVPNYWASRIHNNTHSSSSHDGKRKSRYKPNNKNNTNVLSTKGIDWGNQSVNKCNKDVFEKHPEVVSFLETLVSLSFLDRVEAIRTAAQHPFLAGI